MRKTRDRRNCQGRMGVQRRSGAGDSTHQNAGSEKRPGHPSTTAAHGGPGPASCQTFCCYSHPGPWRRPPRPSGWLRGQAGRPRGALARVLPRVGDSWAGRRDGGSEALTWTRSVSGAVVSKLTGSSGTFTCEAGTMGLPVAVGRGLCNHGPETPARRGVSDNGPRFLPPCTTPSHCFSSFKNVYQRHSRSSDTTKKHCPEPPGHEGGEGETAQRGPALRWRPSREDRPVLLPPFPLGPVPATCGVAP